MTHHIKKSVADIPEEPIVVEVQAHSNFLVTVGNTGNKFLTEIRDNKTLTGIKCPTCKKIYVPPRTHCPTCFARMSEWVKLSGKGTLETFTIVRYQEPYMPKEPPYAYGVIKLDGATTGIVHLLGGVDLNEIKVGMKMEPVFKEEPGFLDDALQILREQINDQSVLQRIEERLRMMYERRGSILDIKYFKPA